MGVAFDDESFYLTDRGDIQEVVDWMFEDNCLWVGHGMKYDIRGLRKAGFLSGPYNMPIADTMIGMNLVDDNLPDNLLGLKTLIPKHFDHTMVDWKDVTRLDERKKQDQREKRARLSPIR
jgi:hypothetical protein